jgi:hypothetical protein
MGPSDVAEWCIRVYPCLSNRAPPRVFQCAVPSKIMLHENDEYLEESVFVEGIEVYVSLIAALGSVTDIDNGANISSTRVTDTRDDR